LSAVGEEAALDSTDGKEGGAALTSNINDGGDEHRSEIVGNDADENGGEVICS
jgi:hypothetical protein